MAGGWGVKVGVWYQERDNCPVLVCGFQTRDGYAVMRGLRLHHSGTVQMQTYPARVARNMVKIPRPDGAEEAERRFAELADPLPDDDGWRDG